MAEINVQLTDGVITDVFEDSSGKKGCPTCDLGSRYCETLTFYILKEGENQKRVIKISTEHMYQYDEYDPEYILSISNIITLLAEVIENPISYDEFLERCRSFFKIEEKNEKLVRREKGYYFKLEDGISYRLI